MPKRGIGKHKKTEVNTEAMNNLLYIIAVILIIAWAIGYFAYGVGSLVHILLVVAIIAVLLRLVRGGDPV